jgi:2-dehydropantoate 2-reductase
MMRRIVVAGAGALGSFFAARMVDCGQQVDILARGHRLGELQASGVKISLGGQIRSLPVSASDRCTGIGRADQILLACKHGDLARLLPLLRECSGPDTIFLTAQNGVEAPQLVAAEFPDAVVIASRVHGFFELQDGLVRHVGVAPSVTFGVAHGAADPAKADCAQQQLARLLSAAQIAHAASPDIRAELWEK